MRGHFTMCLARFASVGAKAAPSLAAFLALVLLITYAAFAQEEIQLSVGHILSSKGSDLAAHLFQELSAKTPGLTVRYDPSLTSGRKGTGRFAGLPRLADIVFLYGGTTDELDEVASLARDGLLQPIDTMPALKENGVLATLHANLLEPATCDGHVWAVPVRVVVPVVCVNKGLTESPRTWADVVTLADAHGFTPSLPEDYYALWLTLVAQRGLSPFKDGQYSLEAAGLRECFDVVRRLRTRQNDHPRDTKGIYLATSDTLTDNPAVVEEMRVLPFPRGKNDTVYCSSWTWYVGVSSGVSGPAREAAAKLLAALVSPDVQRFVAGKSYGASVHPGDSSAGAPDSPKAVLDETARRLAFRASGPLSQAAEKIIAPAFLNALTEPNGYQTVLHAAVTEANRLIIAGIGE